MLAVITLSLTDAAGWVSLSRQMKGVALAVSVAGVGAEREARRSGVGLLDRGDVRLVDVVAPDGMRGLVSVSLSVGRTPHGTRVWHLSVTGLPKGPTESPVRVSDLLAKRLGEAFGDATSLAEGGATNGGSTRHFYGAAGD